MNIYNEQYSGHKHEKFGQETFMEDFHLSIYIPYYIHEKKNKVLTILFLECDREYVRPEPAKKGYNALAPHAYKGSQRE